MRRKILRMVLQAVFLVFMAVSFGGCSVTRHAEDLTALVAQAKEEGAKQSHLESEEKSYKALEGAIRSGEVEPGMPQETVERRFGDPVVELAEDGGETWLYRLPDWDWFQARRIYLQFDRNGKLLRWDSPSGSV